MKSNQDTQSKPEAGQTLAPVSLFYIRPLDWKHSVRDESEEWVADVPMGSYRVERHREGYDPANEWMSWSMSYCFDEYYDEGSSDVAGDSEGKEAAWQDWLKRITPALCRM